MQENCTYGSVRGSDIPSRMIIVKGESSCLLDGSPMNIYESAEDYLEQILMLLEQKGHARSIDIAAGLNVSKPSVSVAMKKLRENGYITMGTDNNISLTDKGYAIARKIYDRHQVLTKYLIQIGVPADIAREDACKIEHDISEETFAAIRSRVV